jgi:hypothetical protein
LIYKFKLITKTGNIKFKSTSCKKNQRFTEQIIDSQIQINNLKQEHQIQINKLQKENQRLTKQISDSQIQINNLKEEHQTPIEELKNVIGNLNQIIHAQQNQEKQNLFHQLNQKK